MTLLEKIKYLGQLLNQPEANFAEGFKADIIIFFDDDFSLENSQLQFLGTLNSKQEIENWIEKLISRFVMKFDSEGETEQDFIYDYLQNG
nr:hypothetical protein [uncultured Flavobacterium sp.]